MEFLRSNLSKVRIPEPTNRIYKQECCICFDTPKSECGLFIDMNSFLAFGKDCVVWNYEKTGNSVYLHIQQIKKTISEDRPLKKPTLLAIGMDGGFENKESAEYVETHSIVILPDFVSLPFPSIEFPEKVRLAVDAVLLADGVERMERLAAWAADKKQVSVYAMDLQQIQNGVLVPRYGWKCCKCEKTDNLWLNLTDGMILCGRKNWDGSGGNNHAIEHYKETNYPLAVKLGTITADLEAADVFSYPEDECVENPLLAQHLAFFGIEFSSLQKTEMTTAERELDQNTNFDWNRIQESGQEVEPLYGPGYTGLVNLGNSCYMASIMQVSLKQALETARADPTVDLNMQLSKLGHGLLSGRYSTLVQDGIPPRMFKTVIAAKHPEFSSMRQQDVLEFFLHFLDQVEQANASNPELDPVKSFKFGVEERILCSSGKVAYNKRVDYILSLNIPLHEATNKEQLEAFLKLKEEKSLEGKEVSGDEIVRPRVPLEACLATFSAPEEVNDFYSTALNAKTTAIKTAGLTSFPDYLVLHMQKFILDGWVPKNVYIHVPDVIDISHMRSKGFQAGEELLAHAVVGESHKLEPGKPCANEDIVSQLTAMGFNYLHCQKAAINTSNAGVEEAMTWLLSHMEDQDINDPISLEEQTVDSIDESKVDTLISFGFEKDIARKALKATGGNIETATDWIFSHSDTSDSNMDATSSRLNCTANAELPDGEGRYKLKGLVSHIGTSTHCGHYVAHVHKDGRWVIFNDDKVGVSINPPKDMGYLYFFERLSS
ncbi:hypothetical protein AQUCO_05200036v1 [Aquilegia coerulea]|uniref:Ubiquitin carboxyl-terminal hydrolase n=1 Tax=Aquilegia coerulea TaxID=218851 RepID=A0A2G5CIR6_AQUCA|nr:hypothetical protein AQUCO_05200036v1 [Aquilegia coerulea]